MQTAKKNSSRHWFWAGLTGLCFLATGCATSQAPTQSQPVERHRAYTEQVPAEPTSQRTVAAVDTASGSLWTDGGDLSQMFISAKARGVGDIVTIHIVESSSASNKASTKTGRSCSLEAGLEGLFNLEKEYPSEHPFFNPLSSV